VRARNERLTTTGRRDRIYELVVNQGRQAKCKCNKPQNTRIACPHVLAVCAMRNFDPAEFTHPLYRVDKLCDTWSGIFKVFGDEEDWPEYNGPKIIPDRGLTKKGRRKGKRYQMTMDVMQGRVGPSPCTICGTLDHTTDKHSRANRQAGNIFFWLFQLSSVGWYFFQYFFDSINRYQPSWFFCGSSEAFYISSGSFYNSSGSLFSSSWYVRRSSFNSAIMYHFSNKLPN
jgi:hypothetical protein